MTVREADQATKTESEVDALPPWPLWARPVEALRGVVRLLLIVVSILIAWARYWLVIDRRSLRARAGWLHRLNSRVARIVGVRVEMSGERPSGGLVVANHLSYLDIILLSAVARPVFVSKAEVKAWPFFGRCACYGGTLFIDRQRRGAVGPMAAQMRAVLDAHLPLVLFPEGTSTGGETVLPFKASLFAPVADVDCPVTACALDYHLLGGDVSEEVCYWKDHDFAPHLLNLLSKNGLTFRIAFGPSHPRQGDRKEIARTLHGEVMELRKRSIC